jgi:rod shape-determining protein MreD
VKWKTYGLILLLIVPAQTTFSDMISVYNVKPDFGLIAACLIGFRRGETEGLAMGFLIGFLMDAFSAGVAGTHLLSKPLAGWISGIAGKVFLDLKWLTAAGMLAVVSSLSGFLIYILLQIFSGEIHFISSVRSIIFPQAVYDGVLGTVIFKSLPRRTAAKLEME